MGVTGLWQLLEPVGRRVNIETLTNKRLAIGVQFVGVTYLIVVNSCWRIAVASSQTTPQDLTWCVIYRCVDLGSPVFGSYARPARRGHTQWPPAGVLSTNLQASIPPWK